MIESAFRWLPPAHIAVDPASLAVGRELGISDRLIRIMAARGVATPEDVRLFLAPAEAGLHDPSLLPDADLAVRRVTRARAIGERVLVYGDFDADGLTGLSIVTLALRRLGLDVEAYAPERLADGHGLSLPAIEKAAAQGRTLIVTADCGTSSGPEIEEAARRGIDVVVTDHHHAATWPAAAVAVVNPQRPDSRYPDGRLTGAGVAWKFACLLLGGVAAAGLEATAGFDLADLAIIGTVADVAPILGENRSIARIGLDQIHRSPRPGLAALLERAGILPANVDLDDIGFAVAPRLNAAGRVGEAGRAARLLLAQEPQEASRLAEEIEAANVERRSVTKSALEEARLALGLDSVAVEAEASPAAGAAMQIAVPESLPAALVVRGEWPIGIIGLIAGRLMDETNRPAVVASFVDRDAGLIRASCRGPQGWNLAMALIECDDLLVRHGGHAAAAGFDILEVRWPEFVERFTQLAASAVRVSGPRELALDIVLPAAAIDYALVRELGMLAPMGPGNPLPLLGLTGFRVVRARSATGGHTQLVLSRGRDVLDAVAFRRPDLALSLREGDRIDVVARAASRRFGGFESIQLEVLDVAAEGAEPAVGPGAVSNRGVAPASRGVQQ
jgi:single-stranded-DNA-specific exonuclease